MSFPRHYGDPLYIIEVMVHFRYYNMHGATHASSFLGNISVVFGFDKQSYTIQFSEFFYVR